MILVTGDMQDAAIVELSLWWHVSITVIWLHHLGVHVVGVVDPTRLSVCLLHLQL